VSARPQARGALGTFRQELALDLERDRGLARRCVQLSLAIVLGGATYGLVFGMWHGPRLAAYVALKLPLVLLVTSALTLAFCWTLCPLLGVRLSIGQVATLTLLGMAVAALLLGSLAPVALVFTVSAPAPTPEARTAHNLLYLMHTTLVGAAGATGTRVLWRVAARLHGAGPALSRVYLLWLVVFAVVGGEVAWALRPFVGSVFHPVVFLRPDALDGNVYEFVFTDIVPYLSGCFD
jgi:hypothetical protein